MWRQEEGGMSGVRAGELETAVEMSWALRDRQVSSVELVQRVLERIEAWEPTINAFSQVWADEALAEARRTDATPPEGLPFAGVPPVAKDPHAVAGHATT